MKPAAIVYTSNTGYTQQYAMILAQCIDLPVYELQQALQELDADLPIIYLGWLMAGKIQGYKKATRYFQVVAVCGVGMGKTGSQMQDLVKTNDLPSHLPLFTLQGGFDIEKLKGLYKIMMKIMIHTAGKGLADKANRTAEEEDMLALMVQGGNRVSQENLAAVISWYQGTTVH